MIATCKTSYVQPPVVPQFTHLSALISRKQTKLNQYLRCPCSSTALNAPAANGISTMFNSQQYRTSTEAWATFPLIFDSGRLLGTFQTATRRIVMIRSIRPGCADVYILEWTLLSPSGLDVGVLSWPGNDDLCAQSVN